MSPHGKVAASNLVRLKSNGWVIDDAMKEAVASGEMVVDWVEGPTPTAVTMPAAGEFNEPVEFPGVQHFARNMQPMAPYCLRAGKDYPEYLTGVEGWPCKDGTVFSLDESEPTADEKVAIAKEKVTIAQKERLEHAATTCIAQHLDEQLTERAQDILDGIKDITEEDAEERLAEVNALYDALLAEDSTRDAAMVVADTALRPYIIPFLNGWGEVGLKSHPHPTASTRASTFLVEKPRKSPRDFWGPPTPCAHFQQPQKLTGFYQYFTRNKERSRT